MRDIDQQILLLERFQHGGEDDGDDLERGGGDCGLGDEDAAVEGVGVDVLGEGAHFLDADVEGFGEFDPDGAAVWFGVGHGFGGEGGVFREHGGGGGGLEGHFIAAEVSVSFSFEIRYKMRFGGDVEPLE